MKLDVKIKAVALDLENWSLNDHAKKRAQFGQFLLQRSCMKSVGAVADDAEVKLFVDGQEVPFYDVVGELREYIIRMSTVRALHILDFHRNQIEDVFNEGLQKLFEKSLKVAKLKNVERYEW